MDITYIRQFRIGPYAIFDIVTSYVGIYLLAPLLTRLAKSFTLHIPRSAWLWFTLPLSVIVHLVFGQNTEFMKRLSNPQGYHLETILLIVMVFMGGRQVRRSK